MRLSKGLSQEDLAFDTGIDRSYLSGVECGKRNIALVNICRLAKAMKVEPKELFRWV